MLLGLDVPSMLGRTELLELLRRLARCSPGSCGCRPVNLANTLRMSVSEMTPLSLPEMLAPASADAGMGDRGMDETVGGSGDVGVGRGEAGG